MKRIRLSRRVAAWAGGLAAALGVLAALGGAALAWTEYAWYASMGQAPVFWTRVASQASVWLFCAAVGFLVTFFSARAAWRSVAEKPRFNGLSATACAVLAGVMAWTMSQKWMVFRMAVARSPFGAKDPQFGLDVGFFVFTLPALELLLRWLTGLSVLGMLIVVSISFIATRLDTTGELKVRWWQLKKTLSVLAGMLMLTVAANFWITNYRLSFSVVETPFAGLSYADAHAQLPANWIMVGLSALVAVVLLVTSTGKRFKPAAYAFGVWVLAAVLVGSAWPKLVETYVAAPNDATLEAPYIARNIEMTRAAYDLAGVSALPYPALTSISASASATARTSLADAAIWAPGSVKQAFDQLQQIRPYYALSPAGYDRYEYGGALHQVLVSAREINTAALPSAAQTWANRHLVYTHGYGLAISSTSRTDAEGFPAFVVGDVPPRILSAEASGAADLLTAEPRIYFGTAPNDYAVVGAGIDEFDYPQGERNVTNRFAEKTGMPVGGILSRAAFALRFGSMELLLSSYIKPESRILTYRSVTQRARKLAPWLHYDAPYAAIVDGRILWIIDAYTSSDHYPYSQPVASGANYLRDSVKVTVDAASGETHFYSVGEDPVRDAWSRIYPTVLEGQAAIPPSVAAHLRAAQTLFAAQAQIYRTYHMTDPRVFYNKEDQWAIAKDATGTPVPPAYLMLDVPGGKGKGMFLLQPFSLPDRDNLVGWMAMSCEPGAYSRATVYELPKERITLGAAQVSARINQDRRISQQLTLWNQPGSVLSFGSMLVMPVQDTVAYVQPIFLRAQSSAINELASVIAVNGDRIGIGTTLDEALAAAWGGGASGPAETTASVPTTSAPSP